MLGKERTKDKKRRRGGEGGRYRQRRQWCKHEVRGELRACQKCVNLGARWRGLLLMHELVRVAQREGE